MFTIVSPFSCSNTNASRAISPESIAINKPKPLETPIPFTNNVVHINPTYESLVSASESKKDREKTCREKEIIRAVSRIQAGWRTWRNRIRAAKRHVEPGQQYVRTTQYPFTRSSPSLSLSQIPQWGMINFTPITGKGPTLSIYKYPAHVLGDGGEAVVLEAPRGFVERLRQPHAKKHPHPVDPRHYADLTSFQTNWVIDEHRHIGRYAGISLRDYLYQQRGVLTVADFKQVSRDLKRLHQRKLYHLDIKLRNMTIKSSTIADDPPSIFFIDCDGITDRLDTPYHGTFFRNTLATDANTPIPVTGRADDEYALLLVLMHTADFSFSSIYRQLSGLNRPASPELREALHHYVTAFVEKHIKEAFRDNVKAFMASPSEANILQKPLHDMIDWNEPHVMLAQLLISNPVGERAIEEKMMYRMGQHGNHAFYSSMTNVANHCRCCSRCRCCHR